MNITAIANQFSVSQAMWGPHLLVPAGKTLAGHAASGIWDGALRLTSELEVEQLATTEAQNPLDVKGGDKPLEFTIGLQVSKLGSGADPVNVAKSWQRSLGKSYLFFVGALPISTSQFILRNVHFSFGYEDTATDGSPLRCDIVLDFTEDTVLATAAKEQREESPSEGASKPAKKSSPKAQSEGFNLAQFVKDNKL